MKGLLVAAVLVLFLTGLTAAEEISDPARTNLLLGAFDTPQLASGDEGTLAFHLTNPYSWSMNGTTLLVEIYAFASRTGTARVEDLDAPPVFAQSSSPSVFEDLGMLPPGSTTTLTFTVETESDTPQGSAFTQGSYFVRFRLEFDYPQGQHAVMVSPGFYTEEEWGYALRDPTSEERETYRYVGNANYTYLGERLGLTSIDGILPDTAFGVKEPLPLWPFYAILGGAVVAFLLFVYYYRKERRSDSKAIRHNRR